jgi:hypothetical protein
MRIWSRLLAGLALALAGLLLADPPAQALPSFAAQTGQPCTACHIGGFGPQLTPLGTAFKIGGYTQRGGEGWQSYFPLSAMVQTSFNHTGAGVPSNTAPFGPNNNFSLDQVSGFLAGGIGEHTGGFVQFTYSNVSNASNLDNTDLRPYTTTFDIGGSELRIGTTVNNNPTVQDPYNSTFAWGYPYIASKLGPTPAASPVLATGFNTNSIGYTVYAWYDHSLYLEAGAYTTPSSWALARFGDDLGAGAIQGAAPYARVAYQWQWNAQAAHIGAVFMQANVNPQLVDPTDPTGLTLIPFKSSNMNAQDRYTDFAFDAGYQWLGDGTHIVTLQGIYTHENQALNASSSGTGFGPNYSLNQFRMDASYWYQNTYGVTFAWQTTWGPANPVLYPGVDATGAAIPITGSANNKPNNNAFIIEADWVPFGKQDSWGSPWVNLKLGIQYTIYTQFNGGFKNYDGAGRNTGDNNTLFLFAWMAF